MTCCMWWAQYVLHMICIRMLWTKVRIEHSKQQYFCVFVAENHLIVNTEAKSVNTSTAVSSLSPVSASPVTSSFSVTVLSPSTVSSDKKRNNHVEMRKNRRNRKEKRLQDAIVSKANNIPVAVTSSSGINGSFSFTAVASHRNNLYQNLPYGGDEGKSSGNSLIIGGDTFVSPVKSNTNTTLPVTGSKHKRNASKTVSGKSGEFASCLILVMRRDHRNCTMYVIVWQNLNVDLKIGVVKLLFEMLT